MIHRVPKYATVELNLNSVGSALYALLIELEWRAKILEQLSAKCFIVAIIMTEKTQRRASSVAILELLHHSFKKSKGK